MEEHVILGNIISTLDNITASDVDVRTRGGDQNVAPPEIVVSWTQSRIENAPGHRQTGGYTTTQSGTKTGVEWHSYWRMNLDLELRFYDEIERDKAAHRIQMEFLPYENDASRFSDDTMQWEVGEAQPRSNDIAEPDWYEAGVMLRFNYLKRTSDSGRDTIEEIPPDVFINQEIDTTSTE